MTPCPRMTGLRQIPAAIMLLGTLWLSGCATQTNLPADSGGDPAEAYTRLGVAYLERDNLPRAMNALDRALEIDPGDAEALQAMAMVHQRQGESALASEMFQRAIQADPSFTRARNNYAAFLYDRGRIAEACEQLQQASQDTQYDNRGQLFANLGQCRLEMGDVTAARESLARAQAIDPRSARSYFLLAELEAAQGNLDRAEQQLERYMRLAGPRAEALRLARDIARQRGDAATAEFYADQLETTRAGP
ncbi:type IV pilus biogenesis/stability protein PilW [Halomonas aestuarii]|uniref:Type IV pilus biogenesis/stability protein PilW n=1 Tax=Halomonas aestuarii TaxID=1897729 RepID=A0A1J0VEG8_9GAMM|nr:type IV pilus biogenesis/stability protein PilW [Halomonas aestuarii]APE30435.1 type IV pilus biogenesis/stability protein PilW [Halomonas aestuarii]